MSSDFFARRKNERHRGTRQRSRSNTRDSIDQKEMIRREKSMRNKEHGLLLQNVKHREFVDWEKKKRSEIVRKSIVLGKQVEML